MADSIDLNAPEVQEAIKQAVEAAVAPLAAKKDELLGELKKARKDSAITPETLEAVENERDEALAKNAALFKEVKDAKKLAEATTEQFTKESAFTQKLLVDNGLSDVLVKAGVSNPAHLKAVKSMLAGQVTIEADGDNRVAKVGDKSLSDFVTEWSATDEGKNFISAPNNSGGGAGGGDGSGSENKATTSVGKIAAGLKKRNQT